MTPTMPALENPDDSPCFGCGPHHARGLRLTFERAVADDGVDEVRSTFIPKADEVGWPTLFHHGLHFLVLNEVSYWAALTLTGKLWILSGPTTYTTERLPRVGVEHVARARILERGDGTLRIRATTSTRGGKPCGALEGPWRPASRAEIERAGVPLPDYLWPDLSP